MKKQFLFLSVALFGFLFSISVYALTPTSDPDTNIDLLYQHYYNSEYPNCVYGHRANLYGFGCFKTEDLSKMYLSEFSSGVVSIEYIENFTYISTYYLTGSVQYDIIRTFDAKNGYLHKLSALSSTDFYSNFDLKFITKDGNESTFKSNFAFKKYDYLTFDLPSGYSVVLKNKYSEVIEEVEINKYLLYSDNYTYSVFLNDKTIIEDEELNFTSETTLKPLKQVTFNYPNGSEFILKNISGEEFTSNSNIYYLPVGDYMYTLSQEGYFIKENIQVNITEDTSFDLVLESKYNPNTMGSIFNDYYNYIKNLVSSIFPLDNPLFLYLITFIIGFFLIGIIRKLLGGR